MAGYVGVLVDRHGSVKILMSSYLSYVFFAVGFALVRYPLVAVAIWLLPIFSLTRIPALTLSALLSGEDERGRAISLALGARSVGKAIGPVLGGFFAQLMFEAVQPVSWLILFFSFLALMLIGLLGKVMSVEKM
ncbi:MAG: MFS transporter [Candidatus Thorarchaeota archaeon]|jgi:MFS family permease